MKDWLKWLILGVLSIVFGLFALGNAVAASLAVTTVTGILFLVAGGFQVAAGWVQEGAGHKTLSIVLGLLMILIGLSFVINPLEGTISLAMLVTILIAASGITRLIFAFRMKQTRYFWPMLISGAVSALLAGYIVANFGVASISLLGILLGIELLFNGIGLTILAFFMKTNTTPPRR
ncbi:HdeD family acid-resistance protein [Oceaniglobus indicus]|uniref:HdeD family acid-resistance protein n=1 Tax=Oceaniglobus indicus TaxID=2047749 RepID=UPI000C1775E5|nr:DUF308 domain-containing protein [Oceaniglobus indicus]